MQIVVSTACIIVVGWYMPYDSLRANRLELFTECVTLCVLYSLIMFTDFVGDPETRYTCGKVFMALMVLYTVVHVSLLVHS